MGRAWVGAPLPQRLGQVAVLDDDTWFEQQPTEAISVVQDAGDALPCERDPGSQAVQYGSTSGEAPDGAASDAEREQGAALPAATAAVPDALLARDESFDPARLPPHPLHLAPSRGRALASWCAATLQIALGACIGALSVIIALYWIAQALR